MQRGHTSPKRSPQRRMTSPTANMFSCELFELAHVLRVRPRASSKVQHEASDTAKYIPPAHLPFIQTAAWHTDDFGCMTILLCSNGALLMWSAGKSEPPVTKQISWFQNPKRAIKAMSLDSSGCWLVCACMDTNLYIVPVHNVIMTAGRKLPSNSPWTKDDITKVPSQFTRSQPGSVVWWHTEDDYQMCIVGTELGEVMFVDLCTGLSIMCVDLKESVTSLELLQDKQHQVTSVMIGTTSGETWQLILESKALPQRNLSFDQLNSPSVASGMGYEMVGLMGIPLESFQAITEWQDRLVPMPVKSAMGEVLFSVQHARKQVFIGAHNQRTDILQVYDTDVDHLPMFIYQLPSGTSEFILSDRLIFTVVHTDTAKTSLCILSSQLAETSQSIPRTPKQKSDSSIIQTFSLPAEEQVVALFKQTKIMEGVHKTDNSQGEGSGLPNRMYNVDGCILITTGGVYECRPSVSPEKLFLNLAINNTDTTAADMLAITTGLDVNLLYEMAADEALSQAKYEHAMKLYQLSKCPFSRRVAQFAKHNRVSDILTYLRQALSKHSDFHTAERKQLSNFALYCFVQQILEHSVQSEMKKELIEAFSQFINDNFDYDQYCALKLLAAHGLKEHLFDVAKARGLMVEALEILYQTGQLHLSTELLNKLAARGFTDIVSKACKGAFLYTMDPNEAVNFLLTKPETILSHLKFLLHQLGGLEEESLVHIARVLDPSRPSFRSLLSKLKTLPKPRSASISSMASLISLESTASFSMEELRLPGVEDLLHLFLCCLLVLNHKREKQQSPSKRISNIKYVCGPPKSPTRTTSRKRQGTVDTMCQQIKLSCGQQHTAVISSSGDVYTWGKSHKGRLGHGDLIEEEGQSSPFRVEILHMHRIKVLSVACGIEHTLALCRDGVYAWGSSEYGQLGQGDNKQHTRPVFITELSDKSCIAVTCGHYHSLALSADQRVWSWGWGVHGQLGMGSIEDVLIPSHVTSLDHVQVTQMNAGYSHTAILTAEGEVYTFGGGLYGQLGLGTNSKQTLPRLVESLKNQHVSMICCGSFETVAVTSAQKLYNWGRNPHYVRLHMKPEYRSKRLLGASTSSSALSHRLQPTPMNCTFDSKIVEIHCGNLHYLVVTEKGEVFTWGFNDHGQLGYGPKEEQPFAKQIPSLKDKHIVTASNGAEFSVAMDTSGQVYIWGRADSGQLGLDSSLIGSAKDISKPVALSSLPLLNSDETKSLSESFNSEPALDIDWKLPDLSQLGTKGLFYGRESLTLALHALYLHYSPNLILRHCMDIKDYLSSSVIYTNLNHWSEALGIRLKFLSQCYKTSDSDIKESVFLEHSINVINHTMSVIEEKDTDLYGYDEQLHHTLKEILSFWSQHKLPQNELEAILTAHIDKISYPLSLLIIRNSALIHPKQHDSTTSNDIKLQELTFSAEFLNSLVKLVSNGTKFSDDFKEYKHDLTEMLSSSSIEMIANRAEFSIGSAEENVVTSEQLLQGIMENLQKDLEKCTSIALSMTTAATIAAAAVSQQRETRNDSAVMDDYSPDVVVFTCNHHFTKIYFMENILPEFQQRMAELLVPLVNTTKKLVMHYNKSASNLLSACPVCVYNSLRSEQLEKASDSNLTIANGFKAKPWDI